MSDEVFVPVGTRVTIIDNDDLSAGTKAGEVVGHGFCRYDDPPNVKVDGWMVPMLFVKLDEGFWSPKKLMHVRIAAVHPDNIIRG